MDSLNFIDIADYQRGMDLDTVFSQNDLHGVIVKATEGTSYVNKYCDPWVQWLIEHKKPWGFYHYLNSSDPVKEAKYFVENCKNYFGHGLPAADYEGRIVNEYGSIYLLKFVREVYSLTGVKPLVYCNLGVIQSDISGFKEIVDAGFSLWLAQYYYTRETTLGSNIMQVGSYYPFEKITMHQYSEKGKLNGYSGGYVDLDIFYGDYNDWNFLVSGTKPIDNVPDVPDVNPDKTWILDGIAYWENELAEIQKKIVNLRSRLN